MSKMNFYMFIIVLLLTKAETKKRYKQAIFEKNIPGKSPLIHS